MVRAAGGFSISIEGEKQVNLALTRVEHEVDDLRPLWAKWQIAFFATEIDLFAASPWEPLSPAYVRWKVAHGYKAGILRASGAMMNSLVSKGAGHFFAAGPQHMEIGTQVGAYPWYHQTGAGHNPVRKPIDLTNMEGPGHFGRALAEWGHELRKAWES